MTDTRRPICCPICPTAPTLVHACEGSRGIDVYICKVCCCTVSVPNLDVTLIKRK
jgi:hypothetical protein